MIPTLPEKVPHPCVLVSTLLMLLVGTVPGAVAQRSTPSAEEAYASGVQLYEQRLYADAEAALASFRAAHPDHSLAGEALYLQAQAALAQNRDAHARRLFDELQRRHPSHPQSSNAQLRLARHFLNEGDPETAERQLASVIESGTGKSIAQALYLQGTMFQERGELEAALRSFERAYAEHPESEVAAASLYNAGATQVRLERYDEAVRSFETLGEQFPESPFARDLKTALAETYYRVGAYQKAVEELERRLPDLSGDTRTRAVFLLAESSHRLGQTEKAIRYYEQVLDMESDPVYSSRALFGLAWQYFQGSDYANAAETFARLREREEGPLAHRAGYYEAASRSLLDQRDRALQLYERVAQNGPDRRLAAEAEYERGLLLYENGAYEAAAEAFRTVVQSYPDTPRRSDAQLWLGNSLFASNQLQRALTAYREVDEEDVRSDSLRRVVRFQEGLASHRNGQYVDAASTLRSLVDNHPSSPWAADALFWSADSHYQMENWNEARTLFQRYLDTYPDAAQQAGARYAVGWTAFKQGDYEAAVQHFRQFLNTYDGQDTDIPYRQDARLRLADSYFALKQYDRAVEAYRRVEGDGSDYATYRAGEALNYAGRRDEAVETLQRLVDRTTSASWRPEALYRLGSVHFQEQNYEAAREAYRRFLEAYPDHGLAPGAQYGIGDSYYNAGEMNEAVEAYRSVLVEHPESETVEDAASSLFFALSASGQQNRAEALIDSISASNPGSNLGDRLRFERARAAYQSGDSDRARSLFLDFVQTARIETLLPPAYYHLGVLYAGDNSYDEAINYLQQLVDRHPDSDRFPEAALRLGDIYLDQGDYDEALAAYRSAAESDQINPEFRAQARYGQGVALIELGRLGEAETLLGDLVEEESQGPILASARLGLARVHEENGDAPQALDLYRTVVETSEGETGAEALYRLGRLLRATDRPQDAIAELERMPSLYAGHPEWEARALLEQARAYRDRGQTGQASQLYDEVMQSYSGTPFADTAESEQEAL